MLDPAKDRFTLGEWTVDAAGNRLLRGDESRPLRHKAMALLVLLARHGGQTVSRDEIVNAVWDGNQFVAPKAINTAIWTIRQALDDDPEAPRYVETVAKKGYRLIAPVGASPAAVAALPPASAFPASLPVALLLAALMLGGMVWYWLQGTPPERTLAPLASARPLTQEPGMEYMGQLSPDGSLVAFAWWQGKGAGRLYLRTAADLNAEPQPISAVGGDVQGLAWAPDGQSIAYVASRGAEQCSLWIYSLKDRSQRELANCLPLFTPTVDWSPDGRWIAFSASAEGVGGLFLINPNGTGLRRLSTAPPAAMADHQPAWSPDGQRLAFARQDPADGTRDLYEISLDGKLERLTHLKLYGLHGLSYVDSGRDLMFSTTRQDARVLLRWDRASSKAVPVGLDGSAPKRNADGSIVYALMRAHVSLARLAWGNGFPERQFSSVTNDRSPDVSGHAAVFVSQRSGQSELWQIDSKGASARQLTRLEGVVAAPAFSPNGDQVALLGSCGPAKRFGLCVTDRSNTGAQSLSADAANYGRPSWHPGAKEIWVASDRGGSWQLWRFAADGSRPPTVEPTEAAPGQVIQWAQDGQTFFYQTRLGDKLRQRSMDGRERQLDPLQPGETLVHWRLSPEGLVVLARGSHERFRLINPISGQQKDLSVHALGTFPELASFAMAADGSVLAEISNSAVADLMQIR
nr:winged helix-turn-helix domain-containing protein [uncultured Rhodoferax sp.]